MLDWRPDERQSVLGATRLDRRPLGRVRAAACRRRRPLGRTCRPARPRRRRPSCWPGPVLPGLVDAHSHAFQRAFAGLSERRESAADDFWSWRDRMYRVALRITPEQLRAVAAMLYAELLQGGYTQVCEFHYLQHDPDGRPYADPLCLSWALADAAADAGIGLTMLPVLYQRAGFAQPSAARGPAPLCHRRRCGAGAAPWPAAQRPAAAERRRGHPLAARGRAGRDRTAGRRPGRRADPHPRGRADGRGRRLPASHRRAPDRMAGAPRRPGRTLAAGACHAQHAGGDRRGGAQRRRRGHLPVHRRQPGRRPGRPAGLAECRCADGHRLGQPCHARLARRTALARIRPAPAAPPAQRQRRAGPGRTGHRGAAVPARAARRRPRSGLRRLGADGRRPRRPAGAGHAGRRAAGRAGRAAAGRAGLLQPGPALPRRDGRRPLGAAQRRHGRRALPTRCTRCGRTRERPALHQRLLRRRALRRAAVPAGRRAGHRTGRCCCCAAAAACAAWPCR